MGVKRSNQAARKRLEAEHSRRIAKQCVELCDVTGSHFYESDAQRQDNEAEALIRPDHPVVIGTGGEAISAEQENWVTDFLLKDPTSVSIDASNHRLGLLERVDAVAPGLDAADSIGARNSFEKILAHQLAVSHTTAMSLLAEAKRVREVSNSHNSEIIALKKQNMARLFMDLSVKAMEALARIRSGGRQNIVVTHKNISVTGGQNIIANQVTSGGKVGDRE